MPLLQQLHEAGLAALGPGSHAAVAGLQYPSEFAQVALHVLRPPLTEAGRHLLAPPLWSAAGLSGKLVAHDLSSLEAVLCHR